MVLFAYVRTRKQMSSEEVFDSALSEVSGSSLDNSRCNRLGYTSHHMGVLGD